MTDYSGFTHPIAVNGHVNGHCESFGTNARMDDREMLDDSRNKLSSKLLKGEGGERASDLLSLLFYPYAKSLFYVVI